MTKFTFKSEQFGITSKKVIEDIDTLDDVLFHFTDFLRGVGYVFDGNVAIVDDQLEVEDDGQLNLNFDDSDKN